MAFGTKATFDILREITFGAISANYNPIGFALADHARSIRLVNGTNEEVYISLDKIVNHIRLTANSFFLLDLCANKVKADGLFIPKETIFYVKQRSVAPTTGAVWLEVISAKGGV